MTPNTGNAPDQRPDRRLTRRRRSRPIAVLAAAPSRSPRATATAARPLPRAGKQRRPVDPSSSAATTGTQSTADAAAADATPPTREITITPKTGTTGASISSAAKVSVTGGTLTSVTMTSTADRPPRRGHAYPPTAQSWTPDAALARGTQYTVAATATDAQGRDAAAHTTFATVTATSSFVGYFTPEDGSTVGVGMPVSINFDKAITDVAPRRRAAGDHR